MPSLRNALLAISTHRTLALVRWDLHFLRVRIVNAATGGDRKVRARVRSMPRPRYLNLGSGDRGLDSPNWINVEGFAGSNTHHLADISRHLPFEDESLDGIFFQHVLEHFSNEAGLTILRECRRVLTRGGVLRVIVPDAELIIRTYFENPAQLLRHRTEMTGLPMEVVNMYAYQRYEHQCLYDYALLHRTLMAAGFAAAERRGPNDGAIEQLTLDDPVYAWESLYVEARA